VINLIMMMMMMTLTPRKARTRATFRFEVKSVFLTLCARNHLLVLLANKTPEKVQYTLEFKGNKPNIFKRWINLFHELYTGMTFGGLCLCYRPYFRFPFLQFTITEDALERLLRLRKDAKWWINFFHEPLLACLMETSVSMIALTLAFYFCSSPPLQRQFGETLNTAHQLLVR